MTLMVLLEGFFYDVNFEEKSADDKNNLKNCHSCKELTIFILDTTTCTQVLWQTVKTQTKCHLKAAFVQELHCL